MIRRTRLAVLATVLALAAAPAAAQPPVWTVRTARCTLILFGSVHLLPTGLDWRPPVLTEALTKADEVWFEIPIDQGMSVEAVRLADTRGMLPRGDSLPAHLTPDGRARLQRVATALGIAPSSLEGMRAWLAEVTLSLLVDARAGAVASQGVEEQIENLAPPSVRRRAFETPRQQIAFLAEAPPGEQVAALEETLREIEERPWSYRRVVDEWMAGDLAGLALDALEPLRRASPAIYQRLITNRNRRWADVIQRRLGRPGAIVIIVGMGHLVGAGGVPALLRAKGIKVDGP